MRYLTRYTLILAAVFCLLVVAPSLYKTTFKTFASSPTIFFSPVIDDFVYMDKVKNEPTKYMDIAGNEYSRAEFTELLPFLFTRDLMKWGTYPDVIAGKYIPAEEVGRNKYFYSVSPRYADGLRNRIPLYPLFESASEFSKLVMPMELFRIKDRIEFVDGKTKRVNEEMSIKFNEALLKAGFTFPAELIAGNTNVRKAFDYGYFIKDSEGRVFHMKKVKDEPFVKDTKLPSEIDVDYMSINEDRVNPSFGLIYSKAGDVYTISKDGYKYEKLNIGKIDVRREHLIIFSDPIYTLMKVSGEKEMISYVFDKEGELYKKNIHTYEKRYSDAVLAGYDALFPLVIKTSKRYGYKDDLHVVFTERPVYALVLSLLLTLIYLGYRFYSKKETKQALGDSVFILFGGFIPFILFIFMGAERRR